MPNIEVSQDTANATFSPITITTRAELEALLANPPEPGFAPVILTIKTKVELANILGALVAYGTANTYAENGLKAIGLGDYYSGNVRGAARALAAVIAEASNVVPLPEFSSYLSSTKFRSSKKSKAGAAVVGTGEDLAPGYEPTHFEPSVDDEDLASVGTSNVW